MNILQINNYSYLKGGAETHFLDLIKLLESKGHDITSFSSESNKRHFLNFSAAQKLQILLEKNKIDLAHVHNINHYLSPLILKVLKKNKIPVVMTTHDYSLISPNYNLYLQNKLSLKNIILSIEFYLRNLLFPYKKLVDVFIAPSEFMKNKLKSRGFKNVSMLHNFTKLVDNEANIGDYFLYFGRLSKEKGLEAFIKNLVKINHRKAGSRSREKDFLFYIVGDGPERTKLSNLVDSLNLNNKIKFLGYKDREKELPELINNAQFVVIPSLCQENCSLSILESMAYGKFVIAPNLGGNSELINPDNGFLYELENPEKMLDKIEFLVDNRGSLKKTAEISKKLINSEFNEESYYQKLINLYKQL
jgi:glycosyltransferase involved in cell wall biosynthesis